MATRKSKSPAKSVPNGAATMPAQPIYALRIELQHVKPRIWRRIEVRGETNLATLHRVIQRVMPWEDEHLHAFHIGSKHYGPPTIDLFGFSEPDLDEKKYRLADLVGKGERFIYIYDFGDDWIHAITIEAIIAPESGASYPRCTAGARAGPPEDCGGPFGYMQMLESLADPKDPEREGYMEWLGDEFDPEVFDVAQVCRQLAKLKK